MLEKTIVAFDPPTAVMASSKSAPGYYFSGDAYYEGENRGMGANLSFYVKEGVKKDDQSAGNMNMRRPGGMPPAGMDPSMRGKSGKGPKVDSLKIEISDKTGKVVRVIKSVPEPGLNRISWRFDTKGFKMPSMGRYMRRGGDNSGGGPSVLPGIYTLKYSYKNDSSEVKLEVISDPRERFDITAVQEKEEAVKDLIEKVEGLTESMEKLKECKASMDMVGKLATKEQNKTLMPAAKVMKKVYTPLYEKMYGKENVQGIYSSDEQISTKLRGIYGIVYSSDPMTPNQEIVLRQTIEAIQEAVAEIDGFLDGEWKAYRKAVEEAGVSLFK